jgi:hypothetical protein
MKQSKYDVIFLHIQRMSEFIYIQNGYSVTNALKFTLN